MIDRYLREELIGEREKPNLSESYLSFRVCIVKYPLLRRRWGHCPVTGPRVENITSRDEAAAFSDFVATARATADAARSAEENPGLK